MNNEKLRADIKRAQPSDIEITKLISCVRYLTGIAERGLKRQIREDESVESFVLGYVQSLETQPSDDVAKVAWIPVGERLPEAMNILDEPCYLEGRAVPALYISEEVMRFDGKRVTTGTIEWFHKKLPHVFTHWMPLPAAPAIAAALKEGGK